MSKHASLRSTLKDWMLPIAMAGGVIFYNWIGYLQFLSPYLIFCMLTITYCRIRPSDFKIGNFQLSLLTAQMLMAAAAFFALMPFSHTVATGVFICIFVPTATAAPVITGMLGGSVTHVATYSLVCNLTVAIARSGGAGRHRGPSGNDLHGVVLPYLLLSASAAPASHNHGLRAAVFLAKGS